MSNTKFEKALWFLEDRIEFIDTIVKNGGVTFANEREWEEARVNLTTLHNVFVESNATSNANIVWKAYSSEIRYLNKFLNDCIDSLSYAIDLFENVVKNTDSDQYKNSLTFMSNLNDVKKEIEFITFFNEN